MVFKTLLKIWFNLKIKFIKLKNFNIIIFLEKIFKISGHTNTIFELTSVQPLKRQIKNTPIDRSNKLKVDQKSLQNNNNDFDDNDINKQNGKQMQVNEKIIWWLQNGIK